MGSAIKELQNNAFKNNLCEFFKFPLFVSFWIDLLQVQLENLVMILIMIYFLFLVYNLHFAINQHFYNNNKSLKYPMSHLELLKQLDQIHIIEAYQKAQQSDRKIFDQQLQKLNQTYPGGLKQYYSRALVLLKDSANTANPYKDYHIGKPNGVVIHTTHPEQMEHYQTIGLKQFEHTAFVLVAGGLGQRLGYPGIKVNIPIQLLTNKIFLAYYIEYILAYQNKFCKQGTKIPLAIMTSDDTHSKTVQLLEKNNNFGMAQGQITIVKQQKVPALIDNHAHFALQKQKLLIETKPHGHGDIHTLLYMHKLDQKWRGEGKKWIVFFQDTNPLAFRSFPMLLGVSAQKNFDFNSIAIPRRPGQALGAITTLVHKDNTHTLTLNVQYNLLEGLFKESGGQKVDQSGYSLFPGNINCFAVKISTYDDVLKSTKGHISEFINPKYADQTKTKFKSSARLECLMQDYPKLLPSCDNVGFTDIPKGFCFTTVKNDLKTAIGKFKQGLSAQSAASCQSQFYYFNRVMLRMCGAQIQQSEPVQAGQIQLPLFPMISISPTFATCYTELKQKVKKLKVSSRSSLILSSNCVLQDVQVDGHVQIKNNGNISGKFQNKSYKKIVDLKGDEEPYLQIRGYNIADEI